MVGLVAGTQFAASLISLVGAGPYSGRQALREASHGRRTGRICGGRVALSQIFPYFGYSLVYPGLGVETVSKATPKRGLRTGLYTALLYVAMAAGSPAL